MKLIRNIYTLKIFSCLILVINTIALSQTVNSIQMLSEFRVLGSDLLFLRKV